MRRLKSFLLAALALAGATAPLLACGGPHLGPRDWTPRRDWRWCHANIKTLRGAIEMYNLDNNTEVTTLDEDLTRTLVREGYLSATMTCPNRAARGAAGSGYVLAHRSDDRFHPWEGRDVACLDHGFVNGDWSRSAHDQLKATPGNEAFLAGALHVSPRDAEERWRRRKDWQERLLATLLALGGSPLLAFLSFLG